MPPKRRAAGSVTSANPAGDAPTTTTFTAPPMTTTTTTTRRQSPSAATTADRDPITDAQDERPTKKPRASSAKRATLQPVPDVPLEQNNTDGTTEGTTNSEPVLASTSITTTSTNTDATL